MNENARLLAPLLIVLLASGAGCAGAISGSPAESDSPYALPAAPPPVPDPTSPLADAPAVRGEGNWQSVVAVPRRTTVAETSGLGTQRRVAQVHAPASGPPPPTTREKLIVSGQVSIATDDVAATAAAVHAQVVALGGEIAGESFNGDPAQATASLQLRLPPEQVSPFIDWLAEHATLEARNLSTQDVSRQVFDQALAIHNLEITMTRLQELAQKPGASLKDVLDVEREMTRVRGDLERLRGEQRGLEDRIARATLAMNIYMRRGVHVEPEVKFELCPQLVLWHFVDAGARAQDRVGAGLSLMFSRWFSLDFELLPQRQGDARSYLLTAAVQTYSDFLGGGRRRYGNPFLGLRLGGGSINSYGAFAYGGDVGVEIVHLKQFLVQVEGRAVGLRYDHSFEPHGDIALEGLLGVGVPF